MHDKRFIPVAPLHGCTVYLVRTAYSQWPSREPDRACVDTTQPEIKAGVIQNYALPFSSVIGTGPYASLRASDTGPTFLLEEEPRSFELHPIKAVFQLVRNYLNSRPDSLYANPHWNTAETDYYFIRHGEKADLSSRPKVIE